MKRLVKLKNHFHIILDRLLMKRSFFPPTAPVVIESLINCIKPNKAIDINSVPEKTLKWFKTKLSGTLTDMINISFDKGIFPDFLKVAEVIPVHKRVKD